MGQTEWIGARWYDENWSSLPLLSADSSPSIEVGRVMSVKLTNSFGNQFHRLGINYGVEKFLIIHSRDSITHKRFDF